MTDKKLNPVKETHHLNSTKANKERLENAIAEMKNGKFLKGKLVKK